MSIIEKKDKILGIVYAYTPEKRYDMVLDLGVQWIRLGVGFPWTDKMFGTRSPHWEHMKEEFRIAVDAGLKVMPGTPGMGGWSFNKEENITKWHDSWPDFVGEKGTREYYDNVRATAKFMCEDLGPLAGNLWQCMNEIDIPTFSGDYPVEVAVDTCRATAEGIMEANPDALCGTNFAGWNENARKVGDLLFRPGHKFRYCGDDQYYGSWQGDTVEKWTQTIDEMYERYGLPVLINEWGYSSSGATLTERPDPSLLPDGWPDVCYTKSWFHDVPGGHTPETAAAYFRRGLEIFANHPHVLGNFMFCFSDATNCWHCGQPECPAECSWGLVDVDCKPKPAYWAAKQAIAEYYR